MRYIDDDEAERLNAEPWQIDLLQLNPPYCSWGPHEDYMCNTSQGWSGRVLLECWEDFSDWQLNDLNECVNFYFEVARENAECGVCGGNGYHPAAQKVVRTFYRHSCEHGETPWNTEITEDEAAALVEAGRGRGLLTPEDFNAAEREGGFGGHDAINRLILVEARLKRLGLPQRCPECDGHGFVFTEERAHVSLILWWLHPRKGCSRGIEIKRIKPSDLADIYRFLAEAARRNASRFDGVMRLAQAGEAGTAETGEDTGSVNEHAAPAGSAPHAD